MQRPHIPVLLNEVIDGLALESGNVVVDGTVGFGGHAALICEAIGDGGTLLAIDTDAQALRAAEQYLRDFPAHKFFIEGNFREIRELIREKGINGVDAVLLDIGMSSFQLDEPGRGFSFRRDEPLIMTLSSNLDAPLTAMDLLNDLSASQLADIIYAYGEEKFSRQIAAAIIEARELAPIKTTGQLVKIIEEAVPHWYRARKIHPATKTFQALRIAVNDELDSLKLGLEEAWELLAIGGRLAVISFHSLEARIVKNFYIKKKQEGLGLIMTKHAVKPSREEAKANPRSRSAELRIIKKII